MSIVSFLNYREFIVTRKTTVTEHYLYDVVAQYVGGHTRGGKLGCTMGMAHDPPFASARKIKLFLGLGPLLRWVLAYRQKVFRFFRGLLRGSVRNGEVRGVDRMDS